MTELIDIEFQGTELRVVKKGDNLYDIHVGDKIPHPDKDAESVMRALAHYLHGVSYNYEKLKKNKNI